MITLLILDRLNQSGWTATAKDGRLCLEPTRPDAPDLTSEQQAFLARHKSDLLRALAVPAPLPNRTEPPEAGTTSPFNQEALDAIQAGSGVWVWSGVLEAWLFWVRDEARKVKAMGKGIDAWRVWTLNELTSVQGMPPEDLRHVAAIKRRFNGTIQPGAKPARWRNVIDPLEPAVAREDGVLPQAVHDRDQPETPPAIQPAPALPGCKFIYRPNGQAGEYAPLAVNPYRGCGHACAYCYVPDFIRMDRAEFNQGAVPRKDFLQNLIKDARQYQAAGITEQVMLSFTTDPYHPGDNSLTRDVIKALQAHGLAVCTLTKGGSRALRDLDLFRPDRDAFASTLTSLDDAFSRKWEPNAALPGDRIATLKTFHEAGIFTWVSLEPTLDTASSLAIIEATHHFVNLFKVGRINHLPMTAEIDWRDYTLRVLELVNRLGVKHYIKRDLQSFLPSGYHNPQYIQQYHAGKEDRP